MTQGDEGHTEQLSEAGQADAVPGCVVMVSDGAPEDRGKYVTLRKGRAVVGSAAACDLVLHDRKVSRRHVELAVVERGIKVRDLESRNGTHVLGTRIEQALLLPGSRIDLGHSSILLLPIGDDDRVEPSSATTFGKLLGSSLAMRRLFALLERLASSELPVLITGETGSGKELVARALHEQGARAGKPFVVLDCGSVARNLIESHVFGHVRGAFTGADRDRAGVFELGDGGTVFLDEIGELPLDLQPRLLRALEAREVTRVGSNEVRRVDVRLLAATHRDLEARVQAGAFREDLYYRLAGVTVRVPALRERVDDIELLAGKFARDAGSKEPLPPAVVRMMMQHAWPGNVRELRNVVQRVVSLGIVGLTSRPDSVGEAPAPTESVNPGLPYKEARGQLLDRFEGAYIRAVLEQHSFNISAASKGAGIARRYFKELMKKHGIYDEMRAQLDDPDEP